MSSSRAFTSARSGPCLILSAPISPFVLGFRIVVRHGEFHGDASLVQCSVARVVVSEELSNACSAVEQQKLSELFGAITRFLSSTYLEGRGT